MKDIEESSKRRVAKKVITPNRKWFVPDYGVSVEADTAEEAGGIAKKIAADSAAEAKKQKDEEK